MLGASDCVFHWYVKLSVDSCMFVAQQLVPVHRSLQQEFSMFHTPAHKQPAASQAIDLADRCVRLARKVFA